LVIPELPMYLARWSLPDRKCDGVQNLRAPRSHPRNSCANRHSTAWNRQV